MRFLNKGIVTLLLIMLSVQFSHAQKTFFSISEPHFHTFRDSTENLNMTNVDFQFKISDLSLASVLNIELAEVMPNFNLLKVQGTFLTEDGNHYIEIDGEKHIVNGKNVQLIFKIPTSIAEKWKFTRISVDLVTGEKSRYLFHRW